MKTQFLLDTNICIYIAKQKPVKVLERFKQMTVGEVGLSVITYGELVYGVNKSQHVNKNQRVLDQLIELIPIVELSPDTGKAYGEIRACLQKAGKPIGNNDLWIAAHALSLDLTLVTNNEKEFSRIRGLNIENWT